MRSSRVPAEARTAAGLAADLTRQPVEDIRGFVADVVASLDTAATSHETGASGDGPVEIVLELVLTADEELVGRYNTELEQLRHLAG